MRTEANRVILVIDPTNDIHSMVRAVADRAVIRHVRSLRETRAALEPGGAWGVVFAAESLPDGSGLVALEEIRVRFPESRRVMVLEHPSARTVNNAAALGAFVVCFPLSPAIARSLAFDASRDDSTTDVTDVCANLSARERDVLMQSARGLAQKEIAQARGIELSTVKTYVRRILRKTGAATMADLRAKMRGEFVVR